MRFLLVLLLTVNSFAQEATAPWIARCRHQDPYPVNIIRALPAQPALVSVLFSPKGGCTDEIVSNMARAKKTLYVMAYSFTSQPIVNAVISARNRGVATAVILDRSQIKGVACVGVDLLREKIPTWVDSKHAIMHNKLYIVDDALVGTGSFNFSVNAEKNNAENHIVIRDKKTAATYKANWLLHQEHATRLTETDIKP
jgi:phosphatidylserine/phosphatidylglycerophosphate/cardiolipin synthase-like enzyme